MKLLKWGGSLGIASGVKAAQRQSIKELATTISTSKSNLATIINAVNRGEMSPEDALIAWNEEMQNIDSAIPLLKAYSSNFLVNFLTGAGDEQIKMDAFNRIRPILNQRLANAFMNPDPTKLSQFIVTGKQIGRAHV